MHLRGNGCVQGRDYGLLVRDVSLIGQIVRMQTSCQNIFANVLTIP